MSENKDFDINRTALKMVHADGFFPEGEAEALCAVCRDLQYVEREYGYEIPNFNLVLPDIHLVFSKILGQDVVVDHKRSGIVRKPHNGMIHFESFTTPDEWCFILALEPNVLNTYNHVEDIRKGSLGKVDSKHVLEGYQFNYRNLFEWDIANNVSLTCNQGVFIRPWVFHSLQDGLVQYYRILPKYLEETLSETN